MQCLIQKILTMILKRCILGESLIMKVVLYSAVITACCQPLLYRQDLSGVASIVWVLPCQFLKDLQSLIVFFDVY